MLIDSHCHLDRLDLTPYHNDLAAALAHAKEKGVEYMLCVCIDLDNFQNVFDISQKYANVFASVGVHPTEILEEEPTVEELIKLASLPKVIALGETGLDFYREGHQKEIQKERFRRHIRAALQANKPLIIHTRCAAEETLQILKEEEAERVGGVFHCFTEDLTTAQCAIEQNFYISFSGIITFQNAKTLQEIVKNLPLDRMLIETDSPYLAPVPFRGKSNEPANVYYVAEAMAKLRNISFKDVAEQTSENFFRLFNP